MLEIAITEVSPDGKQRRPHGFMTIVNDETGTEQVSNHKVQFFVVDTDESGQPLTNPNGGLKVREIDRGEVNGFRRTDTGFGYFGLVYTALENIIGERVRSEGHGS